jgi:hypothetical protein
VLLFVAKVGLTSSWQKITQTVTVPSISGKTIGSDNNNRLSLSIWFDAGSNFNSRTDSLGQQSGTFDIAQVQVEAGPVATPFERRPIGTELALCQRYFQFNTLSTGVSTSTTLVEMLVMGVVPMRVTPTLTLIGGSVLDLGVDGRTVSSVSGTFADSPNGIGASLNVSSTTNNKVHTINKNVFSLSAEL